MTREDLLAIMPYAKPRIAAFFSPLVDAMDEFEINTPLRQAAFLAQIGHESGQLRYVLELASGAAYEGRKDLGNTQPGDGPRFKGRALLQITGRSNYAKCGAALGLDLIAHPELLEQPINACRASAWWWKSHGLNELADEGMAGFGVITRRINGGANGMADRLALFSKAQEVLA